MIICVCNVVTEEEIIETIRKYKCMTIEEVQQKLKIADTCYQCNTDIDMLFRIAYGRDQ